MRPVFTAIFAALTIALCATGCGGGGGGYGGSSMPSTGGSTGTTSNNQTLATMQLAGSNGYISSNNHTVYVLSSDSFNNSTCTSASGCTGLWPVVAPPSGSLSAGFATFVRGDGTTQLSYNGWPLYNYSGDSAAGQTNGNGIVSFGGTWSIARPGMTASSGAPAGYMPGH